MRLCPIFGQGGVTNPYARCGISDGVVVRYHQSMGIMMVMNIRNRPPEAEAFGIRRCTGEFLRMSTRAEGPYAYHRFFGGNE